VWRAWIFAGRRRNVRQAAESFSVQVNNQQVSFASVARVKGSYDVNNLSVGLKANPVGHLLVSLNALIKVNDGGVRARVVPLIGLSYSF
jgi:hypothetical protein